MPRVIESGLTKWVNPVFYLVGLKKTKSQGGGIKMDYLKGLTVLLINRKGVKKMRTMKMMLLVTLVCLLGLSLVYAAPAPSQNISVSAVVPNESPVIDILIKELTQPGQDPNTGTTVTTMTFGNLTHVLQGGGEAGVWYSQKYYCVFIYTTSFGHRYEIRSTCAGLSGGGTSLPAHSFGITPGYSADDKWNPSDPVGQGLQPVGSVLGTSGPAIVTNKVVYTSETAASNRIIRAFYSLPCYGAGGGLPFPDYDPIPLSQTAATYSGTVTINIVAI